MRGTFKVVSKKLFCGHRSPVMVELESTQLQADMFACRMEMMITDPEALLCLPLGGEVSVEFLRAGLASDERT